MALMTRMSEKLSGYVEMFVQHSITVVKLSANKVISEVISINVSNKGLRYFIKLCGETDWIGLSRV